MKITVLGLCGRSVFMEADHFHRPGETVHAHSLYEEPGGKGFNQAVAAARLGAEVTFLTAIGEDGDGRSCLDCLEREGVKALAQTVAGRATACAFILTDRAGENRVTVYPGAAEHLSPEFIRAQEGTIAGSDMLLLNCEYPAPCNQAAAEIARRHGVPVVLNPAPARPIAPELLEQMFLITPNLSEARIIAGAPQAQPEQLPELLRAAGVRRAVVTLGGDGALLTEGGRAVKYPARTACAVDTTGAGDTFTAALAVSLLRGMDLARAAEYALNAAALSVTCRHVLPGLPTWEQLQGDFVKLQATQWRK